MTTSAPAPPTEVPAVDAGPAPRPRSRAATIGEVVALYALCIAGALVLSALLVSVTGGSWTEVMHALFDGSLQAPGRWGLSLGTTAPLLLVALGTIISSKAGLVNIGQEGQLLIGSAFATYVGVRLDAPGVLGIVALCAAGIVGGALWAAIAGGLRYWRGVPEVLTSLLLVTIAANLVGYGLKNTWLLLAPAEGRANRNQVSEQLVDAFRLPRGHLFGNDVPVAVFLAVALAVGVSLGLMRSKWGFRLRMLGLNERVAHRAGVSERQYGMAAMAVSGGFAGLAGAVMLAGGDFGNYQLVPGFAANIGWTGLLVALVARERAIAAIVIAFVFASLRTGSGFLAATGVERRITDVVQALLVLALLVPPALLAARERRRKIAAIRARV